jgi:hypothetical protein
MPYRVVAGPVGTITMETRRDVALTVGAIAQELGEPIHRIEYVIRTRRIEPECLAGHIRVFGADVVERIAEILRGIDRAQSQHEVSRSGEALFDIEDQRPFRPTAD